jgi:hypothetical protein
MKNLNNLLQDSNVLELNATEKEEIIGGCWLSRLLYKIAAAIESFGLDLD